MVLPERNRPMVVNVNVADEFRAGVAIPALQACVAGLGAESGMIGFMDIVAGAVILCPYASTSIPSTKVVEALPDLIPVKLLTKLSIAPCILFS